MALVAAGVLFSAGVTRCVLHHFRDQKRRTAIQAHADFLVVEQDGAELDIGMLICFSKVAGEALALQCAICTRHGNQWELGPLSRETSPIEGPSQRIEAECFGFQMWLPEDDNTLPCRTSP